MHLAGRFVRSSTFMSFLAPPSLFFFPPLLMRPHPKCSCRALPLLCLLPISYVDWPYSRLTIFFLPFLCGTLHRLHWNMYFLSLFFFSPSAWAWSALLPKLFLSPALANYMYNSLFSVPLWGGRAHPYRLRDGLVFGLCNSFFFSTFSCAVALLGLCRCLYQTPEWREMLLSSSRCVVPSLPPSVLFLCLRSLLFDLFGARWACPIHLCYCFGDCGKAAVPVSPVWG